MFKSFTDYLEERKKGPNAETGLAGKPKVKLVADYDGPTANAPPKNKGGDGSDTPYKAANGNLDPNKNADKTGFATAGDKNLVYNPDFKPGTSKLTALGKELPSTWATNGTAKTEHFLQTTRKMNASEFTNYMLKECATCDMEKLEDGLPMVSAYAAGPFHPHPPEAIRYIVALGKKNPKIVEQLIHDAKRSGVLGHILKAALDHPDAYDHLSDLLGDSEGSSRARHLARALHKLEHVGPPMGLGDEEKDKPDTMGGDDSESNDKFDGNEDDDMEDSDMDHHDDEESDEKDDDDSDFDGEDDGDNDDDEHGPDDDDDDSEEDDGQHPLMKNPSARDNLMNAMKAYMSAD